MKSVRYLSNEKKASNLTELKKIKSKPILNIPYRISSTTKRNLNSSLTAESERDEADLIKEFNKKFQ